MISSFQVLRPKCVHFSCILSAQYVSPIPALLSPESGLRKAFLYDVKHPVIFSSFGTNVLLSTMLPDIQSP